MSVNTVDLCFLVDCTGSMDRYMTMAKRDITRTVADVVKEVPDADIKLGFVCYRDWCDGGDRIQTFPFNRDISEFQSFVGSLRAKGGGDTPEDVLGGLWEATQMTWSSTTRVLFHILDAPPHGRPRFHDDTSEDYPGGHPDDKPLSSIFAQCLLKNIDYYVCKLNSTLNKTVRVFKEEAMAVGYEAIEERREIDLSLIMIDVAKAILQSMSVRVSHRMHHELLQPQLQEEKSYKAYCAIDFGTHGTAFAYCLPTQDEPLIGHWPGTEADRKAMTNLLLGANKKVVDGPQAFGKNALDRYLNMDEKEQAEHYFLRRFKMALFDEVLKSDERQTPTERLVANIANSIRAANNKPMRTDIVLREALTYVVNHAMDELQARFDITSTDDVQWILTVPAIWSPTSRKIMQRQAFRAGIGKNNPDQLKVVLEPECASIAVNYKSDLNVAVGDSYMLVDCGGGTVDITCHQKITETNVIEIHMATGGPWGATYIDDAFVDLLQQVFGEDFMNAIQSAVESSEPALMESIIRSFNVAKENATVDESSRNVDLPQIKGILKEVLGGPKNIRAHLAEAAYNGVVGGVSFRRGTMTMSREIWDALFHTVIGPIIEHIHHLLALPEIQDAELRTICVVGGFAQSDILLDRLTQEFHDLRVYRPPRPILAVVSGAVLYGVLPTMIVARRAQKTIGIATQDEWKEATDAGHEKIRDKRNKRNLVANVFFPLMVKGQEIPAEMPALVNYFEPIADKFVIDVFVLDTEDPPRFVPDMEPTMQFGPVECPEDYNRLEEDIRVTLSLRSGTVINVNVQAGSVEMDADLLIEDEEGFSG